MVAHIRGQVEELRRGGGVGGGGEREVGKEEPSGRVARGQRLGSVGRRG